MTAEIVKRVDSRRLGEIVERLDRFRFDAEGRLLAAGKLTFHEDPSKNKVFIHGTDGVHVIPILVTSDGKILVLAHGLDGTGAARPLLVTDEGALQVEVTNAQLAAALTALEDSVEVYGRDYANDVVRSISVDDQGRIINRPAQSVELAIDGTVNTVPVESNALDCRAFKTITFYISNTQDVDVTVEFLGSPDSLNWFTIRSVAVPANTNTYAVISSDHHPFLKVRAVASASPTTGKVMITAAKYAA